MLLRNILLALVWVALTGQLTTQNFLIGFFLSYLLLWLLQFTVNSGNYFVKVPQLISFFFFFLGAMLIAGLRIAYRVLSPRLPLRPAIIAIPLDVQTDAEITFLANLITLTPGTLSLDVSTNRRVMYVHTVYVEDIETFRREIKEGFERRLLEVMR